MKHLKKILLVFLSVVMACLVMTGCSKTPSQEEAENKAAIEAADIKSVQSFTDQQFAKQLVNADYEDFQARVDSGEVIISRTFDNDLAQRWKTFTEKHGKIQKAEVIETSKIDTGYTCKMVLTGEDSKMMAITVTYDKSCYPISTMLEDYTDDTTKTVGTKLGEAGTNIIIGLSIVFLILIFLSIIISLFKYIGAPGSRKPAAAEKAVRQSAVSTPVSTVPASASRTAEVPLKGNEELIAVITAAIAASEGTGTDPKGYVVRSIRRLNSNKWR